ncbi:MAG: hypothetical protein KZQ75_08060 [Candidatus Thiodiazotropha sp. (ex Myrtea spinifera)]|nr:hypothetical protein [Candidatus Thiodiazotropha sp. (ex Myrtea spinifera)]
MEKLFAKTVKTICGTSNSWCIESDNKSLPRTSCEIELEIQGSRRNGYHLVMSPEGFFTADYWYQTKDEAIDSALELFGVSEIQWEKKFR